MKVFFKTYGCQMNMRDTEIMKGYLLNAGIEVVDNMKDAETVILNTCAVREKSANKAYSLIGRLKKRGIRVGVTGCVAQIKAREFKRRGADFVLGTRALNSIVEAVKGEKDVDVSDHILEIDQSMLNGRDRARHAWVNIISGCDKFCTYCIVPYTRGREISRPIDEIVEEVRALAKTGHNQITFLGQNVDSYGKDLKDGTSLAELFRRVYKIEGIERFWFLTSYPSDLTDELIEVVASHERISRNFHLPPQSGSDRILKLMNRRYTRQEYLDLVARIRKAIPQATIGGDIIVGFPGETDEDFEQTLSLVKAVKFIRLNLAPYSPRPGTVASKFYKDDVPFDVKKRRMAKLSALQHKIMLELNEKLLGTQVEIIVEGRSGTQSYGRTLDNRMVFFEGTIEDGEKVKVKITRSTAGPLYGEISKRVIGIAK
ncbi:tRNA (N6-isopentenyl adenosine(37)-C2)-methylthiotransferase MiaB [Mesoaciditoga lauensis]|uniref:tRNA (N6-isopentenyl adenosine(37)-C2)-methylthiotransferase MiaB n=1 Tax=Mesoaciditoga lauensis TaxID=1495039 RepID=UPI00055F6CA2|nr:tRNA (N6-isopentenyl adenosine(37)-C2)-methylthiotransferase MiaB [Mesoaciditoga lauensis]